MLGAKVNDVRGRLFVPDFADLYCQQVWHGPPAVVLHHFAPVTGDDVEDVAERHGQGERDIGKSLLERFDACPRHMDALQHIKESARRQLNEERGLPPTKPHKVVLPFQGAPLALLHRL